MVGDVRFAILMRLRRELDMIRLAMLNDRRLWGELILARTDPDIARTMCARYRTKIQNTFPGCRIVFAKTAIYIHLPERYPNHRVPVCEQLSPKLIECFTSPGLTLRAVEGGECTA